MKPMDPRTLQRWSVRQSALLLGLLAGQLSCGKEPTTPVVGSLEISASGLGATVRPNLIVTGPGGTFAVTSQDTVLRNIEPGTYAIASPTVWVATGRYVADAEMRTAKVTASPSPAEITVSYVLWDSRLTLTVSGFRPPHLLTSR